MIHFNNLGGPFGDVGIVLLQPVSSLGIKLSIDEVASFGFAHLF